MNTARTSRILIVDDNTAIHSDFAKILAPASSDADFEMLERMALGDAAPPEDLPEQSFDLDSAYQGAEALKLVEAACLAKFPYALAFVDMRMPPGWDGLQTIERLWAVDPGLQVVICSAYSDYDWDDVLRRLNRPDKLLVIKKPFEAVEVLQCANALTGKWHSERELQRHLTTLEETVRARTASADFANEQLHEQMRLREAMELELALAQKLESVGRLAAGIAHEINTPIQYISDSVHFLGSAFSELLEVPSGSAATAANAANLAFLKEEVPLAIARTIEGTQRVATIVRAMKEFAHPDEDEKSLADLNRALETTLLIARNEYKYVASVELLCGDLPEIPCNIGALSQVFLNLIVNSAHALADAGRDVESGQITIRTACVGDFAEVTFADNGCGIPPAVIDKIYDPFFTTKEVGRGSGQGLAIARSIVVDKHGGTINVSSTPGAGTCFKIRLPLEERSSQLPIADSMRSRGG